MHCNTLTLDYFSIDVIIILCVYDFYILDGSSLIKFL